MMLLLVVVIVVVQEKHPDDEEDETVDYIGVITIVVAVICLCLALTWGGAEHPWNSADIIALLVVAGVFLAVFAYVESAFAEVSDQGQAAVSWWRASAIVT